MKDEDKKTKKYFLWILTSFSVLILVGSIIYWSGYSDFFIKIMSLCINVVLFVMAFIGAMIMVCLMEAIQSFIKLMKESKDGKINIVFSIRDDNDDEPWRESLR